MSRSAEVLSNAREINEPDTFSVLTGILSNIAPRMILKPTFAASI
jgi:hypothetical protein